MNKGVCSKTFPVIKKSSNLQVRSIDCNRYKNLHAVFHFLLLDLYGLLVNFCFRTQLEMCLYVGGFGPILSVCMCVSTNIYLFMYF